MDAQVKQNTDDSALSLLIEFQYHPRMMDVQGTSGRPSSAKAAAWIRQVLG